MSFVILVLAISILHLKSVLASLAQAINKIKFACKLHIELRLNTIDLFVS